MFTTDLALKTGPELVRAAWATAASFRGTDMRGGTEGGRTDATPAQTDVGSFDFLKPSADGFRNYYDPSTNRLAPA